MSEGSNIPYGLRLAWVGLFVLLGMGIGPSWGQGDEKTLRLSLTTRKPVYTQGEPVELFLTVTNIAEQPVTLSFASAKQYDFVIKHKDHELWRWSNGQMFAMILTHLVLNPKESRRFQAIWLQNDRDGHQVESGSYIAVGILAVSGHPLSDTLSLKIQ